MSLYGLSEVHETDVPFVKKKVFNRDIAVADVMLMQAINRLQKLPRPAKSLLHCRLALLDGMKQVAILGPLQDKPSFAVRCESSVHFQKVW
mmetsp:Transcript_100942/g.175252  ORF Transcript_100942/g.175252 Transcript_100942/m.175252 type:complete len:91 (+) Transcript_100942:801-1073(+)